MEAFQSKRHTRQLVRSQRSSFSGPPLFQMAVPIHKSSLYTFSKTTQGTTTSRMGAYFAGICRDQSY